MRLLISLFAFALLACGQAPRALEPAGDEPSSGTLRIRLALPAGVSPDQVGGAKVRISAAGMDTLEADLALAGTELVGEVARVPAGEDRKLEIFAVDAAGKRILAGELLADVEPGEPLAVALTLQRVGLVRIEATFDATPFD